MRLLPIYDGKAHSVTLLRSPIVKSVGGGSNTVGRRLRYAQTFGNGIRNLRTLTS
jgi:hypothetical protein